MKHIKGYEKFINESNKLIDDNLIIVEKQLLNDFSSNFWGMCMNSSVFTVDEKIYIKTYLSNNNISLVKEEWDWLNNIIDWVVKKGGEVKDYIFDKIKSIYNGIKNFVSSMINFSKDLLIGLMNSVIKYAKDIANKNGAYIKSKISKLNKIDVKNEFDKLKTLLRWWGVVDVNADKISNSKAVNNISNILKKDENNAVSSVKTNIDETNNKISDILAESNEDVLYSFYKLSSINESGENNNGSSIKWLLDFIGQEEMDKDAKIGKKLLWWGKLFLKVLSICLNPLLKIIETGIKMVANDLLSAFSWITKKIGGPPFDDKHWEFLLLGGLMAGLVGIVTDSMLIGHIHFPGSEEMSSIKAWLSHVLEHASDFFPGADTIKLILKIFCLSMTLWHVGEEVMHLTHIH